MQMCPKKYKQMPEWKGDLEYKNRVSQRNRNIEKNKLKYTRNEKPTSQI